MQLHSINRNEYGVRICPEPEVWGTLCPILTIIGYLKPMSVYLTEVLACRSRQSPFSFALFMWHNGCSPHDLFGEQCGIAYEVDGMQVQA